MSWLAHGVFLQFLPLCFFPKIKKIKALCGQAVYFVLTHGDLQRRE